MADCYSASLGYTSLGLPLTNSKRVAAQAVLKMTLPSLSKPRALFGIPSTNPGQKLPGFLKYDQ